MNGTAIWENDDLELNGSGVQNETQELRTSRRRITALKNLTLQLVREVQSIGEVKVLDIDNGLDFYNEVTHFEIDLISRALLLTGGHQARAAKLLNLKGTTLNSKIKSYNIKPENFAGGAGWTTRSEDLAVPAGANAASNKDRMMSAPEPTFA
jgi:DNA-binding NtrC family response regulator